jgi:hypothetical protein
MDVNNQHLLESLGKKTFNNTVMGTLERMSPTLQPIIDAGIEINAHMRGNWVVSGTQTVGTLTARKRYWLWGISLSIAKDVTCDVSSGSIAVNYTPYDTNLVTAGVSISVLTTQAHVETETVMFPKPILLADASNIQVTGTFGAGAMSRTVTAYLTEAENPS